MDSRQPRKKVLAIHVQSHEIACPSENEIYVAEILNWRVQKLLLHPEQQRAAVEAR